MSILEHFLEGFGFRSATPAFESGDVIEVSITGYDEQNQIGKARIGDSLLTVEGIESADVDSTVRVRVMEFDRSNHTGQAERTGS